MARNLAKPFAIGQLAFKNRIAMAPMTRCRAGAERKANDLIAEHYAQRSSAGLIITEATTISPQANGFGNTPGIYTDEQAESWKQVTDAVHKKGSLIFLQLWHMGRASHSSYQPTGELPVAPSALAIEGELAHTPTGKQPYEVPRALETAEIASVVQDYAKAAKRARDAGFDGVEIHGANGYLIDQFLQSKTNQRTDAYGGSVDNRNRFMLEVVGAVAAEWPAQRVAIRLSPNGVYNGMGSPDFREQFAAALRGLDRFDLAFVHVMDGLAFGFHQVVPPRPRSRSRSRPRGLPLPLPLAGSVSQAPSHVRRKGGPVLREL